MFSSREGEASICGNGVGQWSRVAFCRIAVGGTAICNSTERRQALKWITALQLEQWADALQSRVQIPGLVADLIWATSPKIRRIRFPQGDKGQVRGFDGYLDADSTSPFVPDGRSIWEFGTSGVGKTKANADYDKRTAEVSADERADTTLVLVTPRTWNDTSEKVEDWLAGKNASGDWKGVVYLESALLEDWLSKCPAVASRWAKFELEIVPPAGMLSTEEFWQSFSTRFQPALVEDVLLAGREKQAEELLQKLRQEGGRLAYSADTTDEVIAFTVAAIRSAPEPVRQYLESRTLIVDTADAANALLSKSGLIYLPRNTACECVGQMLLRGPTVVSAGADDKTHGHIELRRPSSRELGIAIAKMGMTEDQGYEAARICGRSLAVLARQYPSGTAVKPKWLDDTKPLIPVMLAGAWASDIEEDQSIISSLTQQDYEDAEDELRKYLVMPDSPIENVGNLWATRAPVDAFLYLAPYVGRKHLQLFKDAINTVFASAVRSHKPPSPDDPFVRHTQRDTTHSEHLRNGLMTTLLHMAVLHAPAKFTVLGGTPKTFVDDLVGSLPELSSDHRLMASLGQDLALLAEASPNSFLEALERQLEGPSPSIRPIFDEYPGMLTPVTYHCGLLWTLEVLAWIPGTFDRAVRCLAELAAIDPGGKMSNRPINSLRAIFLSWIPCAGVNTARRLAALQAVVKDVPTIAWPLLETLLPRSGDNSSATEKPKFREYEEGGGETLTYGLVWESEGKIVELAIIEAGHRDERWKSIIDSLQVLQDSAFEAVVGGLDSALNSAPEEPRTQIWKTLNREVKRHQKFSKFDWTIPEVRLRQLASLVDKYAPTTLFEHYSWLFDDWMPPVEGQADDDVDSITLVEDARLNALRAIREAHGVQGLLDLMRRVKIPRLVGYACRGLELPYDDLVELFEKIVTSSVAELELIAGAVLADGFSRLGQAWEEAGRSSAQSSGLSSPRLALVLESLPENARAWSYAASFGEEVENSYWSQKTAYQIEGNVRDLSFAIKKYRCASRPAAALSAASRRFSDVPTVDLVSLLKDSITEQNSKGHGKASLSSYEVENAILNLSARVDISLSDVAALEFAYFPVLRNDPMILHRLLLEQPSFFVEMLCKVFRGKSEDPREISEHEKNYASNAYRLLKSLKTLPGQSGEEIDETALLEWCLEVQRLSREQDRTEITDQLIGQVLAHSPLSTQDGAWPHQAVRNVIETLASAQVERGISIERFNMRGVFGKAIGEGGDQERALAKQTREWAEASAGSVRTRAMLEHIAQSWDRDAERSDIETQQNALRF